MCDVFYSADRPRPAGHDLQGVENADSSTLVNSTLLFEELAGSSLDFTLSVNNMFDSQYTATDQTGTSASFTAYDLSRPGRTVYAKASIKF